MNSDIEIKFNKKHLPFECKLLEYRLMINKTLYDDNIIDFNTFKLMEKSLLKRLTKKDDTL